MTCKTHGRCAVSHSRLPLHEKWETNMECYHARIPDGVKVLGVTATGYPSALLPGEYLVHRLRPGDPSSTQTLLRFVGADVIGRDVHVPLDSVQKFLAEGALLQRAEDSSGGP
jgi:hypothetical protein